MRPFGAIASESTARLKKHEMLKIYYSIYRDAGGLAFFCASPYLYVSVAISFLIVDRSLQSEWYEQVLGMFPSLIGFSLAAFAIVIAILGATLDLLIKPTEGETVSPLAKITALVVHTATIQLIALLIAFSLAQSGMCGVDWIRSGWTLLVHKLCTIEGIYSLLYRLGLLLSVYGIVLMISTLLTVYQICILKATAASK